MGDEAWGGALRAGRDERIACDLGPLRAGRGEPDAITRW